MTDHEAELATLHQEATQQRARIKRLEAALRQIAGGTIPDHYKTGWGVQEFAHEALQEAGQ